MSKLTKLLKSISAGQFFSDRGLTHAVLQREVKTGFTLAEVLITLGIVGVVSTLTIPVLYNKWQDNRSVVGLKMAYSLMENAYRLMLLQEGHLNSWSWPDGSKVQYSAYFIDQFCKYLQCSSKCYSKIDKNCSQDYSKMRTLNGTPYNAGYGFTEFSSGQAALSNGMSLGVQILYPNGEYKYGNILNNGTFHGSVRIDINGSKGPNRFGHDIFFFSFAPDNIIPGEILHNGANDCDYNFKGNSSLDGISCSVYVLRHSSLDYKYRDVGTQW